MKVVLEPMDTDSKLKVTRFVFSKQENRDFLAMRYGTYEPFVKPAPKSHAISQPKAVRRQVKSDTKWGNFATAGGYGCIASVCLLVLTTEGFGYGLHDYVQAGTMVMLGFSVGKVLMEAFR